MGTCCCYGDKHTTVSSSMAVARIPPSKPGSSTCSSPPHKASSDSQHERVSSRKRNPGQEQSGRWITRCTSAGLIDGGQGKGGLKMAGWVGTIPLIALGAEVETSRFGSPLQHCGYPLYLSFSAICFSANRFRLTALLSFVKVEPLRALILCAASKESAIAVTLHFFLNIHSTWESSPCASFSVPEQIWRLQNSETLSATTSTSLFCANIAFALSAPSILAPCYSLSPPWALATPASPPPSPPIVHTPLLPHLLPDNSF